jgi:hypothetical protein
MNKNTRKDKITAIRILQQSYCVTLVLSIKSINELTDEDINELYNNLIEHKVRIKKFGVNNN